MRNFMMTVVKGKLDRKHSYISQSLEGGFIGRALSEVEGEARTDGSEGSLKLRYTTKIQKTLLSFKEFSSFNIKTLLGCYRHKKEWIFSRGLVSWPGHYFAAWKFLGSHLY